jgi:phosphatidate cytidylyltransferase
VLRTRVWTALVALPALLAMIFLAPAIAFTAFVVALSAVGLYEISAMTGSLRSAWLAAVAIPGSAVEVVIFHWPLLCWWIPILIFLATAALLMVVARKGGEEAPKGPVLETIGALWVGGLFPYFALLRNAADGIALTTFVLLLVVVSDSAAYFIGSALGRHKLAPRVSPNKTIEGAVGALVCCAAAGIFLGRLLMPAWTGMGVLLAALTICILAQFGDLVGSAIKRAAGVKDSGWIFPGHGGLLDRTCSLVFATAFAFYYNGFFARAG